MAEEVVSLVKLAAGLFLMIVATVAVSLGFYVITGGSLDDLNKETQTESMEFHDNGVAIGNIDNIESVTINNPETPTKEPVEVNPWIIIAICSCVAIIALVAGGCVITALVLKHKERVPEEVYVRGQS